MRASDDKALFDYFSNMLNDSEDELKQDEKIEIAENVIEASDDKADKQALALDNSNSQEKNEDPSSESSAKVEASKTEAIDNQVANHTSTFDDENDEITEDEFENILDEIHGKGVAPGLVDDKATEVVNDEKSIATVAEPIAASSFDDENDEITEDEFENILDQIHGKGVAPGFDESFANSQNNSLKSDNLSSKPSNYELMPQENQSNSKPQLLVKEKPNLSELLAKVEDHVEVVATAQVEQEVKKEEPTWKNIEVPKDFQALFFKCKGMRFAVPLIHLGGIVNSYKLTPIFNQPKWNTGLADIRERKINVVDLMNFIDNKEKVEANFNYLVILENSSWAIGCDEIEGNSYLEEKDVTWRAQAGERPWLSGIVKAQRCALLHVDALINEFNVKSKKG